jgi:L-rhamnose isomerase
MMSSIEQAYQPAKQRYADLGVDTDAALKQLSKIKISLQCWQGDDVGGFESSSGLTDGGM